MITINTIEANDSKRSEEEPLSWKEFLEKGDKFIIEVPIEEDYKILQLVITHEKENHDTASTVYSLILKEEKLQMTQSEQRQTC